MYTCTCTVNCMVGLYGWIVWLDCMVGLYGWIGLSTYQFKMPRTNFFVVREHDLQTYTSCSEVLCGFFFFF